jgi:acyl carrier protein
MGIKEKIAERTDLCLRIKNIIVERLMLDIPVDFISNDQPLVGRGLELDSIDSLEISVAINMEMDVIITDNSSEIFSSVNRIADFVEAEQAKAA